MESKELEHAFNAYYQMLYRFARLAVSLEDAHDIVMGVFARVAEEQGETLKHNGIKYYLYMCVKNKCIDFIRREEKFRSLRSLTTGRKWFHEELVEIDIGRIDRSNSVSNMMDFINKQLPTRMKEVILLSLQDISRKEIALKLGVTENTVRNTKAGAIKYLKLHYGAEIG